MACSTEGCSNEKVVARGLCRACYHRLRRNGSVQRIYVSNTGECSVEGCGKKAFSKNLCAHHYEKQQHPFSNMWRTLRSRYPGEYPPAWDRLEGFLADIGERPTPKHQLRRVLTSAPYSASNVKWVKPVGVNRSRYTPEQAASYDRAWNLDRKYGLTVERYQEMLAEQGGVCACCKRAETHVHKKSGKLKDLAVDHDHATKKVRGLLCFNCNQGIGRLKDDPALLRAAADYLDRHLSSEVPGRDPSMIYYDETGRIDDQSMALVWPSLMPAGVVG